jgi:hypothetical protein
MIGVGCGIGIAIRQGASGYLGPRYGWRASFLAVSVPAIVCTILVWICILVVERCRGEMQPAPRVGGDCKVSPSPLTASHNDSGAGPRTAKEGGGLEVKREEEEFEMAGRVDLVQDDL